MKVKELIEQLQTLDPEYNVFQAGDDEGNSFNEYDGASVYYVHKNGDLEGYGVFNSVDELKSCDQDPNDFEKAVVIW